MKNVEATSPMTIAPLPHINPISLYNTSLYVRIPAPPEPILSYTFSFRTTDENGLLLFINGTSGDFVVLELIQGTMQLVYRLKGNTDLVTSNSNTPLNDGNWHSVSVTRLISGRFHLRVDEFGYPANLVCRIRIGTGQIICSGSYYYVLYERETYKENT